MLIAFLALCYADVNVDWTESDTGLAEQERSAVAGLLEQAGLGMMSSSFASCSFRADSRRAMNCKFGVSGPSGVVKHYMLSELKSASHKFLRRSMDSEFVSIYVLTLASLCAACRIDPIFKRFVTNKRNRAVIQAEEEGCFLGRPLESYHRLQQKKAACEDAVEVRDKIVAALSLVWEMARSPIRNRAASHLMCLAENGKILPPQFHPDWEEGIQPIFEELKIKNDCQEKERGLDLYTAYMVYLMRSANLFFPDKAPPSIASDFSFYTDLDSRGVIDDIGVRDKHVPDAKKENKTGRYFAEVGAKCICNEDYEQQFNSTKFPLLDMQSNVVWWTPPEMKDFYDEKKRTDPKGKKKISLVEQLQRLGFAEQPEQKQRKQRKQPKQPKQPKQKIVSPKKKIEKKPAKKSPKKQEPRKTLNDSHPLGFKILTMKVAPDQIGPLKGLIFNEVAFEDIVTSQLHLKHVENQDCILVQRLAKLVGVGCADVISVLEMSLGQQGTYLEQLQEFYEAARASVSERERFTERWADRSMRVTIKKFKKEKAEQYFLLSEYIDMTQLVSLLDDFGIEQLECENFVTSYTLQMILNWLLPLNENNTSNFGVDKHGRCVRFDFCDTDHTKELWVRQALKGLNTHGKSMEMRMISNGRRPLVEIFHQGLKNLGEVGVRNIIDSVVHKLSALTEDVDLGELATRWLKFTYTTPLGVIYANDGSAAELMQMIEAYMKKDKKAMPACLSWAHGCCKYVKVA